MLNVYKRRGGKKKMAKNEESYHKINLNWYPGHMAKARREIKEKLGLIDIVIEVIDARMPSSSRVYDLDELIGKKPKIMVMTKYDLCDQKISNQFIEKYQKEGNIVFPVTLLQNFNRSKIMDAINRIFSSENEKRKQKGLKPRVARVLIVGVPNAGKSTLINQLVGKKVVQTGNRPGVTQSNNWIRISKDVELMDTPGILWPKLANQHQARVLAALSSIKEEILDKEDLACFILEELSKLYPETLEKRYGIKEYKLDALDEILTSIAKKKGALLKMGVPDYEKVYNIIINDLKTGALGCITLDRLEE